MARILYVSNGYCTHDRRFLAALAAAGHEMWFVACDASAVRRDLASLEGAVHWLPPLSNERLVTGTSAWAFAQEHFNQIVHDAVPELVQAGPIPTAGLLAATSGFHPLLIMSWGSDVLSFPDEGLAARRITEFVLQGADMAIADCEAVRKRIMAFSELPSKRIVCLPWGVDHKTFRPKTSTLGLRQRLKWTGSKVIISTRSLESIHQPMIFLQAMKYALSQRGDAHVLMIGDGEQRRLVESFISENGLGDRIHLPGRVPESTLPDYFAEADLYVSATPCDGSSISLLQAMACGLPVAVADAYGNREWVTHGENGWLYPARNAEALAQTISQALEDEDARQFAGQLNIQITHARANWDNNFPRALWACDELLAIGGERKVHTDAQFQNR